MNRRPIAAAALAAAMTLTGACEYTAAARTAGPAGPAAKSPRATGSPTAAPRTTAPARRFDEAGFDEDLRTATAITDGYWRRHWTRFFTGSYRSPRVVGLYDGSDPAATPTCGGEPLERDNAEYCPAGDFLAWDAHLMRTGYANGDAWVYLVVAHEWGHAVQNRLQRRLVSAAAELQADCLAGAVLYGSAADGDLRFEAGDAREIVDSFQVIGDRTPWTRPGDHGTASQRLQSFSRGGAHGVPACFT